MKTPVCVPHSFRGLSAIRRTAMVLGLLAVFVADTRSAQAQAMSKLGFADYENVWYTSGPVQLPGVGDYSATNTAIYTGHVGPYAAPGTTDTAAVPTDGTSFTLTQSAFGQPVGGATFFGADFFLGEEITPPGGDVAVPLDHIPVIDPPQNAFYVPTANKLFAGDYGLVTITWKSVTGTTFPVQYVISNRPIQDPVRIYHTEAEKGGLVDLSAAPTATIHYNNSILNATDLWISADKKLHARDEMGMVVMHYDQGTSFAGIEIVDVRAYIPDATSQTYAGSLLIPKKTVANMVPAPTVSRGDDLVTSPTRVWPYAFQYGSDGQTKDPTVQGQVFAVRPTLGAGQIHLFWKHNGRYPGMEWPFELHAYAANWDPLADWQRIYYTADGTFAPTVNVANVNIAAFFYNDEVTSTGDIFVYPNPKEIRSYYNRSTPAKILLRMDDYGSTKLSVLEFVELRPYSPDYPLTSVNVGDMLEATRKNEVANPQQALTLVKVGWDGNPQNSRNYAYQHNIAGGYMGAVFAVRPTQPDYIEIFFKRLGKKNLVWPYEMHRYAADWSPSAQKFVRGTAAAVPGPQAPIPENLHAQLMPYQEYVPLSGPRSEVKHATLSSDRFFSDTSTRPAGDYYAVLQYQTGPQSSPGSEWVGFEVAKCVQHNDTRYFNLNNRPWAIGTEITTATHQGPAPGYIYHVHGVDTEDKYDPKVYNEGGAGYATGQVFPIFPGRLEVWWSNLTTHGLATGSTYTVQWPSNVARYECNWPASPETMVIANQMGSDVVPALHTNPEVYYQNDKTQVGYNPNYEHAALYPFATQGGMAAFALRCDLNAESSDKPYPYVLLKYRDATDRSLWRYRVFRVVAEDATYKFSYLATAGRLIPAPFPLPVLPDCGETSSAIHNGNYGVLGPYWQDRNFTFWSRAARDDGGTTEVVMRYWYPIQQGFVFPLPADSQRYPVGERTPWLNKLPASYGRPVDVKFTVRWPEDIPILKTGETLTMRKYGLPEVMGQCSVEVIYESLNHTSQTILGQQNVRLIDPLRERKVDLDSLPTGADAPATENIGGKIYFMELPPHLRGRVSYDPINHKLALVGEFYDLMDFDPDMLLMNVLTDRDKKYLYAISTNAGFRTAIDNLCKATSEPIILGRQDSNSTGKALVGVSAANGGYVTLAMQNHQSCRPLPVSLEIIRVAPDLFKGAINVIEPDCVFDEKLTLRFSGDFAGKADRYVFRWEYHPDIDGNRPSTSSAQWFYYPTDPTDGSGALDVTIAGPGLFTLSDNWFRCKYRWASDPDTSASYSRWTIAQLAPGWIKRVVGRIDPFEQRASGGGIQGAEQRFSQYQTHTVNTMVSMIAQAGARWVGNVPMNCGPGLDSLGLIEIYDTVLGRGKQLSIDQGYKYPPANNALLLAAGRIADLYTLLGNEAYADAADPTIAFGTNDGTYGTEASSLHCFMNQTSSLLEEELGLLRGRDDGKAPGAQLYPLYNRLMWNFTRDITGGEVAYALNYNIQDSLGNVDGSINELDAMKLYPQGHGDAWGHYLTAITRYYDLLKHPNFDWVPRAEAVLVGGQAITVDYMDERKFARVAAAKARTGSEIVNLTYRQAYVEDPAGQWQGYKDSDTSRAWGLSEWASRAGQGAYFDWVVANSILPSSDTQHTGIQKIDRTTVPELREIAVCFNDIQIRVDEADIGLNPLGLAKNVVPFDISPAEVDNGKTHFEQVYERSLTALNNAVTVFDHATNCTQLLRRQADKQAEFQQNVENGESDFNSRLVEIFGYPYEGDIGEGKTYPQGYDGPDLYHYDYVDASELLGTGPPRVSTFTTTFTAYGEVDSEGNPDTTQKVVTYHLSLDGFGLVKPEGWGQRRAPGEIQKARSQILQLYGQFEKLRAEYSNLVAQISGVSDLIDERITLKTDKISILNTLKGTIAGLNTAKIAMKEVESIAKRVAHGIYEAGNATAATIPKNFIAGLAFGGDLTAPAVGAIKWGTLAGSLALQAVGEIASIAQQGIDAAKEAAEKQQAIDTLTKEEDYAVMEMVHNLRDLVRQEQPKRLEIATQIEAMSQAIGEYRSALAKGLRVLEDRTRFRTQTASKVQDYRYKDMAFRIFRNDALQKYRAQFDMAARYVYLAAKAYDYETNLLDRDRQAGQFFMTSIVRARAIGSVNGGVPRTGAGLGDPGLADIMARMKLNWDLSLKGQLGFNNPQIETNRFSLRRELFRTATDDTWREVLRQHVVDDLLSVREFKRYCRVFEPHQATEPGIVIPIPTTVNFGFNFFGMELVSGDSAYDSTNFATKIRSVGVWFTGYDALTTAGLSNTPRIYLIPVGYDIMRSPTGETGEIRVWKILDQKLPTPFPIGPADLASPSWIPMVDTLSEEYAAIRRFSSFRAYHDAGELDPTEMSADSRLVGRSVWNTRWLLIIPAGSLHSDRQKAIDTFVNGVTDIKIFFQTYAYSGN